MLLAPFINALLGVLELSNDFLNGLELVIPAVTTLQIPWPVPWVPHEPVIVAFSVGVASTTFPLIIKFARWLYGMAPVVQ